MISSDENLNAAPSGKFMYILGYRNCWIIMLKIAEGSLMEPLKFFAPLLLIP